MNVFGSELKQMGFTRALPENTGLHSLGCCWGSECRLTIVQREMGPRLKLHWCDQNDELFTAVADIRYYEPDHHTLCTTVIEVTNKQLAMQERTLLSVGLSRPYHKSDNEAPMHWLQINNIYP